MSFLQKTRVVILGHMNNLLDEVVDLNSIPVLKQYVRDLEDAIADAKHNAAVAAAQVTTLGRESDAATATVDTDKRRAQAFLAQGNEKAAREVASRIADHQQIVVGLTAQIAAAKQQADAMEIAVEKMKTKHDSMLSRVRDLDNKDRGAKNLDRATASMKAAGAALSQDVEGSIDDVSKRIESHNDVAQEEFSRTVGELDTPEDPLKTEQVDGILAELKGAKTAA